MAQALTQKEAQALVVIESFIAKHGYAPTVREVAGLMRYQSSSTAYGVIERLEKKGYISKETAGPRTIRILKSDRIEEIVEYCSHPERYDIEEHTPPECINQMSVEQQLEVWVWLEEILQRCSRMAIDTYLDE